jgi:hypothetical protein
VTEFTVRCPLHDVFPVAGVLLEREAHRTLRETLYCLVFPRPSVLHGRVQGKRQSSWLCGVAVQPSLVEISTIGSSTGRLLR